MYALKYKLYGKYYFLRENSVTKLFSTTDEANAYIVACDNASRNMFGESASAYIKPMEIVEMEASPTLEIT